MKDDVVKVVGVTTRVASVQGRHMWLAGMAVALCLALQPNVALGKGAPSQCGDGSYQAGVCRCQSEQLFGDDLWHDVSGGTPYWCEYYVQVQQERGYTDIECSFRPQCRDGVESYDVGNLLW